MIITVQLSTQQLNQITQQFNQIADHLSLIELRLRSIDDAAHALQERLAHTPGPAKTLNFQFQEKENTKMPLILPDNQTDTFNVVGTDADGFVGASLGPGQTVTVVSADPATVVVTLDATPKNTPDGVPSVASGTVAAAKPPKQVNAPITLTATVLNADGSTAETVTDTVTVQPGTAASIGILFGTPTTVSGAGPAAAKSAVRPTAK